MSKAILIVLDGLNHRVGTSAMGYMMHLTEKGYAGLYVVKSELPSMSRPLYETLMTGLPPVEHGVLSNQILRKSNRPNIFSLAREAGLTTGAAAYSWINELYNETPFDPMCHRIVCDEERSIQHGMFYYEDMYPDSHLFADGFHIHSRYNPDLLLIHSMNIDYAGHRFGSDSKEYRQAAIMADTLLSLVIPDWLARGFQLVITADHGMNRDGLHNGVDDEERLVPMWVIGDRFSKSAKADSLNQLALAPLICRLMNIAPSGNMRSELAETLLKPH